MDFTYIPDPPPSWNQLLGTCLLIVQSVTLPTSDWQWEEALVRSLLLAIVIDVLPGLPWVLPGKCPGGDSVKFFGRYFSHFCSARMITVGRHPSDVAKLDEKLPVRPIRRFFLLAESVFVFLLWNPRFEYLADFLWFPFWNARLLVGFELKPNQDSSLFFYNDLWCKLYFLCAILATFDVGLSWLNECNAC